MKASAIALAALLLFAVRPAIAADEPLEEPSVTSLLPGEAASQPSRTLAVPAPTPTPAPNPAPAGEGGLMVAQILLGTLATVGTGATTTLLFGGLDVVPLVYLGLAVTPAIGSETVCAVGRWSRSYDGSCAPALVGGYLGAIIAGGGLGLYLASIHALGSGPDGESNDPIAFLLGAVLGGTVGTAAGATIGWYFGKRLRDEARVTVSLSAPPLPPPAALAAWPELRARPLAAPTGLTVDLPLLAVRF